jgi:hypothetical protein
MQSKDLTGFRLWIIDTNGQHGLGFSRTRIISSEPSRGEHCVETATRFLLHRSNTSEPVRVYCECYEEQGDSWQYVGVCTR